MRGGGLPAGYSLLLAGPSGSGKAVLATQFLAEGARIREARVIAAFEKSPHQLLSHTLNKMAESGHVGVIDTRTLDRARLHRYFSSTQTDQWAFCGSRCSAIPVLRNTANAAALASISQASIYPAPGHRYRVHQPSAHLAASVLFSRTALASSNNR